jgi:hypothetical protein
MEVSVPSCTGEKMPPRKKRNFYPFLIFIWLMGSTLCFPIEQRNQNSLEKAWEHLRQIGPVLIKEIRIQTRAPKEQVRKLEIIKIREALEKAGIDEAVRIEIVRKDGKLVANLGSYSPALRDRLGNIRFNSMPSILEVNIAKMEDPEPLPDDELRSCKLIFKDLKGKTKAEIHIRLNIVKNLA